MYLKSSFEFPGLLTSLRILKGTEIQLVFTKHDTAILILLTNE